MTDLKDAVLTREMIEDAFAELERETDRYNREGYRRAFPVWILRKVGHKFGWRDTLPPGVPDDAIVSMSERGPRIIYVEGQVWIDPATKR